MLRYSVIFVVAISEFDQVCYEDEETNRITEALNLFEEMCNSKYFENIPMVVLLNKVKDFGAYFSST